MSNGVPRKRRPSAKMRAYEGLMWLLRYGGFDDGDRLPSERALCERLDVSKTVLHPLVDDLVKTSVVETRHGSGTYLLPRRPVKVFQASEAFSETVASAGMEPGAVVLDFNAEEAPEDVARELGLSEGDEAWRLVRLRTADGAPVVVQTVWMARSLFPDFDEHASVENLYELLREHYGYVCAHGRERVTVTGCDEDLAAVLDMQAGQPVYWECSVDETADGLALVYSKAAIRPDRFQFASVELLPGFKGRIDLSWLER